MDKENVNENESLRLELENMRLELERLKSLIENLHDVVYEVDNTGTIRYVSPNIQHFLGFTQNELTGKIFYDYLFPEDIDILKQAHSNLGIEDYSKTEYRYYHKNGEIRWCRSVTKAILENGKVTGGRGVLIDITNEKNSEDEIIQLNSILEAKIEARTNDLEKANKRLIEESNQNKKLQQEISNQHNKLNQILDGSRIGTWEWEIPTDKLVLSDLALDNIEYSRDEIADITMQEFMTYVHSEDIGNVVSHLTLLLSNQINEAQMDVRFVHKTKGFVWHSTKAQVVSFDNEGNPEMVFGTSTPIQERKEMEIQLAESRLAAEKANASKTEFLSRMSHELRTPMNSILGFAQLLELSNLTLTQTKSVNHILKSGKHLLDLINEVLEISRIEAGKLDLSLEPVAINQVVHEVTDLVKPLADKKSIKINLGGISTKQLFVFSDLQRTKQILLNLINNAIKYNREGGEINLHSELKKCEKCNDYFVRISVKDNGYGIREEDLPKLFIAFERIGSEKSRTEGTGLGLAVAKKLIDALNGHIGVESTFGVGSTFWIDLPTAVNQATNIDMASLSSNTKVETTEKEGIILYIEDNPSNVELVSQVLEIQRPKIKLISNEKGLRALELAKEYRPNIILLDLNLPDIHGSQVIKLLKKDSDTIEIPVVIISADAMPLQLQNLINLGAVDYLTKPIDLNKLLAVIDELIF